MATAHQVRQVRQEVQKGRLQDTGQGVRQEVHRDRRVATHGLDRRRAIQAMLLSRRTLNQELRFQSPWP